MTITFMMFLISHTTKSIRIIQVVFREFSLNFAIYVVIGVKIVVISGCHTLNKVKKSN